MMPPAAAPEPDRRARPGGRSDRIIAASSVVNFTLGGVWVVLYVVLLLTGRSRGADYTAFYTGWRMVLEGQGAHLYDPVAQALAQRQVLGGATFEQGLNPFNNPPHMVVPFLPLALLPLDASYVVWTAIQAALLAGVLAMLLRGPTRDWRRAERVAVAAWLVGMPALGITIWQGAFSLLMVVGVLGTYVAMVADRDRPAGLGLVVASIKPQAMAGPAVAVLVSRRWQAVASAAIAGGAMVILGTIVLGPGIWGEYLAFLGTYAATFDRYSVVPSVMWNLRGTLALLLGREQAQLINSVALAGFVVGMVLTALLWRRGWSRKMPEREVAARFGLTIVITLLLSPHLNPHDDLLAVVAAVLAYGAWRGSPKAPLLAIAIGLAPTVILLTNGIAADAPTSLPVRVPTLLLVGLGLVLAAALRRGTGRNPGDAGSALSAPA